MKKPAVFLDRDGTVNREVGFLDRMDRLELLPGVAEAMRSLQQAGYLPVIVTNQSGIARGYYSERRLKRIHGRLRRMLRRLGIKPAGIYYCPFYPGPARIKRYRQVSELRKPAPGMLLHAAARLNIDLAASWMIGDRPSDIGAGKAAGCSTVLVRTGYGETALKNREQWDVEPDLIAADLPAAAAYILQNKGAGRGEA